MATLALVLAAAGCASGDESPTALQGPAVPTPGRLSIQIEGLSPAVPAAVLVRGTAGPVQTLTASGVLNDLPPGVYDALIGPVTDGSDRFVADRDSVRLAVVSGGTTLASFRYAIATGAVAIHLDGLPAGSRAAVDVLGPEGFLERIVRDTTLRGLVPGTYTVRASPVTVDGTEYRAGEAIALAVQAAPLALPASIRYVPQPRTTAPDANLTIDGMHVQQVVQRYAGTVPLVAGRDGLLRVFVRASSPLSARPRVRVRLYRGSTLVGTTMIDAPGPSVPTSVDQSVLGSSWNMIIPAAQMTPNLRVLADVDPENLVAEALESDNTFPHTGGPLSPDVREMPRFELRLVPIAHAGTSSAAQVTAASAEAFVARARALLPLGEVTVDVREPFTTSQPPVQPNDGNRSWPRILSELNALRAAEGGSWYYAGITPVSYTSGIAGLGYVPGRTTLSWDRLPSAGEVLAHELGHNFGRLHAPCGGAGGADPAFPYPGGSIGNYGFDFATATIKAPTSADVMGYCNSTWISDYTYVAVMNHRLGSTFATTGRPAAATQPRRGLLVWGRIEHGRPVLEPAFEIDAPPALPTRPGPHRLRALGPLGETLTELAFDGEPVADAADSSARHFAFVVPLSLLNGRSLSRLVLTAGGASVERRAAFQGAIDGAEVSRNRSGRIRVEARNPLVQGVMIRSAATGRILAFGRDGVIDLASQVAEVEVTLSDGVQSTRFRTRVTGPAR